MDIAVNGTGLVTAVSGIVLVIAAVILGTRMVLRKHSQDGTAGKSTRAGGSPLKARNKYPEADAFRLSGTFFNIGLVASLGLTLLAFSWTQYEKQEEFQGFMTPAPPSRSLKSGRRKNTASLPTTC